MKTLRCNIAAGLLLAFSGAAAADPVCRDDRVQFSGQGGTSFSVELADTPETRARGLMYRRELPADQGMLFIYDRPQPASFWMRNTLIPLDLIFLDDRGVIRHIHANARPLDETPIPGAAPGDADPNRLMVLEIGGGLAAEHGLAPGQAMAHPRLNQTRAALPCAPA
ncbi:DUF192 domain-containing protein [Paracoccus sp. (in: a-proteobacteria)]|uniref:DUF192 domain-containing protein n=1 Tax=Paracoccus sp. TaxID=267 RepID=UPI0026E01131|nr:DUF192 domain-containing protein [Paracoccus sp. (in: a-proteobacteria)]MDO5646516.1 DUF192 domain-containing protein [Paracoccus sp. (in: a-proteobacteria)]